MLGWWQYWVVQATCLPDHHSIDIVETCDEQVLLTRRAKHMRTFPGIWVPPGGHIEVGETLIEAGLRELQVRSELAFTFVP